MKKIKRGNPFTPSDGDYFIKINGNKDGIEYRFNSRTEFPKHGDTFVIVDEIRTKDFTILNTLGIPLKTFRKEFLAIRHESPFETFEYC